MSTSRIFRAFMSLFACIAVLSAVSATASAATTGSTGPTGLGGESTLTGKQDGATDSRRKSTRPVLKVSDRSVNFGGRFRLRGKTGNPYAGHARIQARFKGSWHTLRKVRTNGEGRFRTRVRARANTSLRVLTGEGRRSKARKVTVIGHIKLADSERYVKLGRSLLVRGTVVPRGVRTLRLRVPGEGVISTRTTSSGRFRFRWEPRNNGDFNYRVWARPSHRSTGDASRSRKFSALRPGGASYYGPGLYGNGVACGGTLLPTTRGVANKYLPCGTRVILQYGDRTVVARVIDRGPYVSGRDWDLTEQTKKDLGFGGVGTVWTNK